MSPMESKELPELDQRNTFLGHPKGLFLLFLVEMWERFSYYGMRALLVLYLVAVIAANQLTPGTYTNVVEFMEVTQKEPEPSGPSQARVYQLVVGGAPAAAPVAAPDSPGTRLRIQRLKQVADPANAEKRVWVVDEAAAEGPVVLRGAEGSREFENATTAWQVTNPTDQTIELHVGVRRSKDAATPTYFLVNEDPGHVVAEIKPDSKRGADEPPFRAVVTINTHDSGRNWDNSEASVLYGWYTGLAYLFPIIGGIIADRLIGTHRSMLVGGILISVGHIILGISGMGTLARSAEGMALFITGLATIVLGTGHFKPCVSVMVGQLYRPGDPRRDGAFTIFYMGINLGAFICAFVCGTLGETVGWHYGFGSAAVGMLLGLFLYMLGRPLMLKGVGEAPRAGANSASILFLVGSLLVAGLFGLAYYFGALSVFDSLVNSLKQNPVLGWSVLGVLFAGLVAWVGWFIMINSPGDRGPVLTIFIYMLFNAFFWIAFEQAGSSLNVFTKQNTDRVILGFEVPATWFQSVNAGLIFIMAPLFAAAWTRLGQKGRNPSQPVKIAMGLIFLGVGYLFMVWAGRISAGGMAKASMFFILMTYFWHTVGELCLSPTGLSYVTKAAPARFVSLLMGIWFVSSFIANLGGGLVASQVKPIESGAVRMFWQDWGFDFGGKADFFFLFVVGSIVPGVLILVLSPIFKRMQRSPDQ